MLLNSLISNPTADVARATKLNCHMMIAVNHEAICNRFRLNRRENDVVESVIITAGDRRLRQSAGLDLVHR